MRKIIAKNNIGTVISLSRTVFILRGQVNVGLSCNSVLRALHCTALFKTISAFAAEWIHRYTCGRLKRLY